MIAWWWTIVVGLACFMAGGTFGVVLGGLAASASRADQLAERVERNERTTASLFAAIVGDDAPAENDGDGLAPGVPRVQRIGPRIQGVD